MSKPFDLSVRNTYSMPPTAVPLDDLGGLFGVGERDLHGSVSSRQRISSKPRVLFRYMI